MTNAKKVRAELSLEVLTPTSIPLEAKIMEFKEDPEKMDELRIIIDDIVANAQKQAELKVIDNKVNEKIFFPIEFRYCVKLNGKLFLKGFAEEKWQR